MPYMIVANSYQIYIWKEWLDKWKKEQLIFSLKTKTAQIIFIFDNWRALYSI